MNKSHGQMPPIPHKYPANHPPRIVDEFRRRYRLLWLVKTGQAVPQNTNLDVYIRRLGLLERDLLGELRVTEKAEALYFTPRDFTQDGAA